MHVEERLKAQLDAATDTVPTGPDLTISLQQGRRQRRTRGVVAIAAATVAVGAIGSAAALVPWTDPSDATHSAEYPTSAPREVPDFVAGTDIDEVMQRTFNDHVPDIGWADDVYPSDWTRNTPLPDQDFALATDWDATFALSPHDTALVVMGFNSPDESASQGCKDAANGGRGAPPCHETQVGDGSVTSSAYSLLQPASEGLDTFTFITSYQTADGFTVNVLDRVQAPSWRSAKALRSLDETTMTQLALDPALTFPAPQQWPS